MVRNGNGDYLQSTSLLQLHKNMHINSPANVCGYKRRATVDGNSNLYIKEEYVCSNAVYFHCWSCLKRKTLSTNMEKRYQFYFSFVR